MIIPKFLKSDGALSGLILLLFLATNRYILGWDDQHLEIPLLKHLIDPTLYVGDYYVESLARNFSSYLYPILSRIITINQIPSVYLGLYLMSRYFMFFWMFKIWRYCFQNRWIAFIATITLFLGCRTEEFIYRTFSHQEFSYAIIFAGIYAFYRNRFFLAAILLGIAANFHFLYALFPMFYIFIYLVFFHQEKKWKNLLVSSTGFLVAALPFLAWAVPQAIEKRIHSAPTLVEKWIPIFKIACPYNFFFHTYPLSEALPNLHDGLMTAEYLIFIIVIYLLNWLYLPQFRADRKTQAICLGASILLTATFIFSYILPSRFALDLNLIRNFQYLQWILSGYTAYLVVQKIKNNSLFSSLLFGCIFTALALHNLIAVLIIFLCLILYHAVSPFNEEKGAQHPHQLTILISSLILFLLLFIGAFPALNAQSLSKLIRLLPIFSLLGISAIALTFFPKIPKKFRYLFLILPLLYTIGYFGYLNYVFTHNQREGSGFWQLQREWEQMQHYVQRNTPKTATLLVPYDMEMGGFRIFSERSIVASYRDCGIVGFDYAAVKEWQRRINDIQPFQVFTEKSILPAVQTALQKYKVDYIIFMRYYAPERSNRLLRKIFETEIFSLYKVNTKR